MSEGGCLRGVVMSEGEWSLNIATTHVIDYPCPLPLRGKVGDLRSMEVMCCNMGCRLDSGVCNLIPQLHCTVGQLKTPALFFLRCVDADVDP